MAEILVYCTYIMATRIEIDNLKELDLKGSKALRFNVIFINDEEGGPGYIVVPGFRLINGLISPPCSRSKNNWYPNIFLHKYTGRLVYKALKKSLEKKELTSYALTREIDAISELCDISKTLKCAPFLIGKLGSDQTEVVEEEDIGQDDY